MKFIILLIIVIFLWYTFGRKWQWMSSCQKLGTYDECEKAYNEFKNSSVKWSPIVFR